MADQVYELNGAYYKDPGGAVRLNAAEQGAYLAAQAKADPANKTMADLGYANANGGWIGTNTAAAPEGGLTYGDASGGTGSNKKYANYPTTVAGLAVQTNGAGIPYVKLGNTDYYNPQGWQQELEERQGYDNNTGTYYGSQSALQEAMAKINEPMDMENNDLYKSTMAAATQAGDKAGQQAMENFNTRGILNSTITTDRVSQIKQDAITSVLPALIEKIYGIKQNEINSLINLAGTYGTIENNQAQNSIARAQLQIQQQAAIADQRQNQIANALAITEMAGFVTNEAAPILGVPAGTPAQAAKQAAAQLNAQIENNKAQLAFDYAKLDSDNQNAAMDRALRGTGSGGGGGSKASAGEEIPYYMPTVDNLVAAKNDIRAGNETVESVEDDITTRYKYGQLSADAYNTWMRELRPELIAQYSGNQSNQTTTTTKPKTYGDLTD